MSTAILDRRIRAEKLFDKVQSLDGDRRTALLNKACADDLRLRSEVDLQLAGQSLAETLAARNLTVDEILTIAIGVSYELGYAHRYGLTHGRISTQNIMVCPGSRIRLQRFGNNSGADIRADILSFGAVLDEMIAGKDLPQWLRAIAGKASHPDRAVRYSTAVEIQKDLERLDHESRHPKSSQIKAIIFWLIVLVSSVLLYGWVVGRRAR